MFVSCVSYCAISAFGPPLSRFWSEICLSKSDAVSPNTKVWMNKSAIANDAMETLTGLIMACEAVRLPPLFA